MPKKLEQTMTQEVIARMAEGNESTKLYEVFKCIARKNGLLPESYPYFFRQVQKRFMSWLDTNERDWRSWPEKARRYLAPPPPTEIEATPIAAKPAGPTPTAMPVKQIALF
jgi:hypothetical protein